MGMRISEKQLISDIKSNYGLLVGRVVPLSGFYDKNYKIRADGKSYFLKIYGLDKLPSILFQIGLISRLTQSGFPAAEVITTIAGVKFCRCCGHYAVLQEFLPGRQLRKIKIDSRLVRRAGSLLGELHKFTYKKKFFGQTWKKYPWDLAQFHLVTSDYLKVRRLLSQNINRLIRQVITEWRARKSQLSKMRPGIVHNDFHGGNILLSGDQRLSIVDFGDAGRSWYIADVAVAMAHICFLRANYGELIRAFLSGYEKKFSIPSSEKLNLSLLMRMRAVTYIVETSLFMRKQRHELYSKTMTVQINLLKSLEKS